MAQLPEPRHTTAAMIYQTYENDAEDGNRPHLGASLIGHSCERYLWLTFRWAGARKFDGRMLRLFETGQLEEARLVRNLRRIGVEVHEVDPEGKQWRVSAVGGHFGGSMDGAAVGLPEAPKSWHVLEFKTHNDKSFKDLTSKGVEKAKPQHYAQMQTYMGLTGMNRAFYMAVNKNTDELYTERVDYDLATFTKLMHRAERVITANEPPLRCSNDASWYVCKMCDFAEQCHGTEAPAVNCRTCAHSTPEIDGDGRWSCAAHNDAWSHVNMREGCKSHRYIPILLERFATLEDCVNGDVDYRDSNNQGFTNGEGQGALSSREIHAIKDKASLGFAAQQKAMFQKAGMGGEVIG